MPKEKRSKEEIANYAKRLVELRTGRKITQRELSNATQIDTGTISKIENACNWPNASTRRSLANFFGTDEILNPLEGSKVEESKIAYKSPSQLKAEYLAVHHPDLVTILYEKLKKKEE